MTALVYDPPRDGGVINAPDAKLEAITDALVHMTNTNIGSGF